MEDFDRVELLDDARIEWQGTWKEFVGPNRDAGMEREEIQEIADTLDRGDDYMDAMSSSRLRRGHS